MFLCLLSYGEHLQQISDYPLRWLKSAVFNTSIINKSLAAFSAPVHLLPAARRPALYNVGINLSALGTDLEFKSVLIPPLVIVEVFRI